MAENQLRFVERGEVIQMSPCGSPYQAVLHAVGVDVFYDTSAEVVRTVVTKALRIAAELSASKVTLSAIATGYGRLSLTDFADGIRPIMEASFSPIREVTLCLRNRDDADTLAESLPKVVLE